MLKVSHMKIAANTLEKIQDNIDWKINRKAYLAGSILPDINCAFPTHTIGHTLKRFKNRLIRMENTDLNIIRSFTLGVITHYICDYFCYAHNLKYPDPCHAIYERIMRNHLRLHESRIADYGKDLAKQWDEIKKHTVECLQEKTGELDMQVIVQNIQHVGSDHIEYILDTVIDMHKKYIDQTSEIDQNVWYKSINKIQLDIDYATFMCEKIALLILAPNIEVANFV